MPLATSRLSARMCGRLPSGTFSSNLWCSRLADRVGAPALPLVYLVRSTVRVKVSSGTPAISNGRIARLNSTTLERSRLATKAQPSWVGRSSCGGRFDSFR